MPNNTSPLLAATIQADDIIPHVVLNTSIGSPPSSPISRHGATSQHQIPTPQQRRQEVDIDSENEGDAAYDPSESSVSDILPRNAVPFYRQPQFYSNFLHVFAQNFLFPFINGVMLGFGEICANEIAFRMGWFGVRNLPIYSRRAAITFGHGGGGNNNYNNNGSRNSGNKYEQPGLRDAKNGNGREINEESEQSSKS